MSGLLPTLTANVAGRVVVPELRDVVRDHKPSVVVVTEAYHAGPWLRERFPDYRVKQYSKAIGAEGPDIAVLVSRDLHIMHRRPMVMREPWTWHGRHRQPRVYPVLVLADHKGRKWPMLGMHAPPGGPAGENARAWAETRRRAGAWLLRQDGALAPGDWNATAHELTDQLPAGLQIVVGTKVDHTVTHDLQHKGTKRLDPPEGMHGWIVYQLHQLPS